VPGFVKEGAMKEEAASRGPPREGGDAQMETLNPGQKTQKRRKTMSTDTLSKFVGTWEAQIANVKARLPQMPQAEETVQGFETLIVEAKDLQSNQDVYRSKLRETTLRTQDILRRGRSFRNRLVAAAQSVFGVESPLLLELGGKPRLPKSHRRRTLDEKVADLKEQLAAAEAAAGAAKAKKKD
jgi:hypothetical protein